MNTDPMETLDAHSGVVSEELTFVEASTGKRFLNMIIDAIGYYALFFVLLVVLIAMTGNENILEGTAASYIMIYSSLLIYYTAFEAWLGRTPGKFVTGTKVIYQNGDDPSFNTALARSASRLVPFDGFSFLGNGRGWHDNWTNTYVIDIKKTEEARLEQQQQALLQQQQQRGQE